VEELTKLLKQALLSFAAVKVLVKTAKQLRPRTKSIMRWRRKALKPPRTKNQKKKSLLLLLLHLRRYRNLKTKWRHPLQPLCWRKRPLLLNPNLKSASLNLFKQLHKSSNLQPAPLRRLPLQKRLPNR
jgi:hypothetical protein